MKIGIIGLPQTGKKTLFEVLTGHSVSEKDKVSLKAVKSLAEIKDPRFDRLVAMYCPKKEVRARIDINKAPVNLALDRSPVQRRSRFGEWRVDQNRSINQRNMRNIALAHMRWHCPFQKIVPPRPFMAVFFGQLINLGDLQGRERARKTCCGAGGENKFHRIAWLESPAPGLQEYVDALALLPFAYA